MQIEASFYSWGYYHYIHLYIYINKAGVYLTLDSKPPFGKNIKWGEANISPIYIILKKPIWWKSFQGLCTPQYGNKPASNFSSYKDCYWNAIINKKNPDTLFNIVFDKNPMPAYAKLGGSKIVNNEGPPYWIIVIIILIIVILLFVTSWIYLKKQNLFFMFSSSFFLSTSR